MAISAAANAIATDPLTAYVTTKGAHAANPLDNRARHNLYIAAVAASDRISPEEIAWAESIAATAMPFQSRHMILKADGLIECCPNEADAIISELERRRIGGHTVTDLRKSWKQRMETP